jgi:hypothetical protein
MHLRLLKKTNKVILTCVCMYVCMYVWMDAFEAFEEEFSKTNKVILTYTRIHTQALAFGEQLLNSGSRFLSGISKIPGGTTTEESRPGMSTSIPDNPGPGVNDATRPGVIKTGLAGRQVPENTGAGSTWTQIPGEEISGGQKGQNDAVPMAETDGVLSAGQTGQTSPRGQINRTSGQMEDDEDAKDRTSAGFSRLFEGISSILLALKAQRFAAMQRIAETQVIHV